MSKQKLTSVYFPSEEIASTLKTANDWTFYILNKQIEGNNGIAERNFYKLFMLAKDLPELYGVPEEIQPEVTESILSALKALAQM